MLDTQISLTQQERNALQEISRRTGKAEGELLREAVERFIAQFQKADHPMLMRMAKGMWKDRQDLPSFRELRSEWDRI